MKKNSFFAFLFLAALSPLFSLDQRPWIPNIWEFQLGTGYTYSRYNHIQDAHPRFHGPSNDHLVTIDLGLAPLSNWSFEAESEFAETPRTPFTLRSIAAQARQVWLDDILGDPFSFLTGFSLRGVFNHNLRDVSCPYHAEANLEAFFSLGKEWDKGADWRFRVFGTGTVGQASRGYPWARGLFAIEGKKHSRHQYGLFSTGYFGFGPQQVVHPDHFFGYAKIHHQSIDLALSYTYLLEFWGDFTFGYGYRIFARSFPEHVNFLSFYYHLPFWPF